MCRRRCFLRTTSSLEAMLQGPVISCLSDQFLSGLVFAFPIFFAIVLTPFLSFPPTSFHFAAFYRFVLVLISFSCEDSRLGGHEYVFPPDHGWIPRGCDKDHLQRGYPTKTDPALSSPEVFPNHRYQPESRDMNHKPHILEDINSPTLGICRSPHFVQVLRSHNNKPWHLQ